MEKIDEIPSIIIGIPQTSRALIDKSILEVSSKYSSSSISFGSKKHKAKKTVTSKIIENQHNKSKSQ